MCLDAVDGRLMWKTSDGALLGAIGSNGKAQHYVTGYATTCYVKCDDNYIYFAGPQRNQMVVASADDGSLAWTYPHGNLQLVLRDDAIYAAGPVTTGVRSTMRRDANWARCQRGACTRPQVVRTAFSTGRQVEPCAC